MTDQGNQTLEIAYLALGRLVAAECPVGFASASLRMESGEKGTRLWIAAAQPDGTKVQLQPGADAARDILETLRGIRNAMAREGGALWRNCVVTLKAGGHFAMEVQYCPGLAGPDRDRARRAAPRPTPFTTRARIYRGDQGGALALRHSMPALEP